MKIFRKLLILAVAGATAAPALADEITITQQDKKFSERKVTIKVGDTIVFVNEDGTTHNVHSMSEGFQFDLGAQAPGVTDTFTFENTGRAKVRCAIHPKMKLDVTVE